MNNNVIIGTAGHVDHGKTSLIKALTQIDTDRLKEERERGISIELGFANLHLPSGSRVGIIDVPGHERYIRNMLAGAGSVDLVVLVVAADEGVMPQTKEHLDILRFLNVKAGLTVLTKIDTVDEEWLEFITEEVREYIQNSFLADQPIVPVSSHTGLGLDQLVNHLDIMASYVEEKNIRGPARLFVDRVFTKLGFGTVVTGTLISGTIETNKRLELLPNSKIVRVRQLQVFGETRDKALAGQRVALNLANLEMDEVDRGMVFAEVGRFTPSDLIDVRIELLPQGERKISNRQRIRIYHGTLELFGRVTLLEGDELLPGQSGLAQIILEEPIAAGKGDRFVFRRYSPQQTLGGGVIINPNPEKRYRRKRSELIAALLSQERGNPEELVVEGLLKFPLEQLTTEGIINSTKLQPEQVLQVFEALKTNHQLEPLAVGSSVYWIHKERYDGYLSECIAILTQYHHRDPLGKGMRKEQLRSTVFGSMPQKLFEQLIATYEGRGEITVNGPYLSTPGYTPILTEFQQQLRKQLLDLYYSKAYQPPEPKKALIELGQHSSEGESLLNYLIDQGELIPIGDGLVFHPGKLEQATQLVKTTLEKEESLTLSQIRDLIGTSRKYALSLTEYWDGLKITKRVGDIRVLWS